MDQDKLKIKFFITNDEELFLDAESTSNEGVRHLCKVFGVEVHKKDGMSIKLESPEFDDLEDAEIWVRDQPFWKPRVLFHNMPVLSGDSLKKMKLKELREIRDLLLEDEDIIGGLQYAKTIIATYENEADCEDYYICGRCCAFFDDDQAAIKCYNKALELSPNHLAVMVDKGMSLLNLDQSEDAFALFRNIFKDVNPTGPIWYRIGSFHLNKGDMVKGINALRLAVALEPELGGEEIFIQGENRQKISEILAKSKEMEIVGIEEII